MNIEKSLQKIDELDLNYVAEMMIHRENWDEQEAYKAVIRYKKFLKLLCKYSDIPLAPVPDIDEVWHTHILHTKNYTRDCLDIFGKFAHHTPVQEGDARMEEVLDNTTKLYWKEYNESYTGQLELSIFW